MQMLFEHLILIMPHMNSANTVYDCHLIDLGETDSSNIRQSNEGNSLTSPAEYLLISWALISNEDWNSVFFVAYIKRL